MARNGKNKTGRKKQGPYQGQQQKKQQQQKPKVPAPPPQESKMKGIVEGAVGSRFRETHGIIIEYPVTSYGVEMRFYLDEIEDREWYKKELLKVLNGIESFSGWKLVEAEYECGEAYKLTFR